MERVWIDGKRTPFYSRASEADAVQKAQDALAALKKPILRSFEPGATGHFIYGEWADRNRGAVRPGTRRKYNSLLSQHILPALGHIPLAQLDHAHIQGMMNGLERKDGREGDLSPRHRREILLLTKDIVKFAMARKKLVEDPTSEIKPPRVSRKKRRTEPELNFTSTLLAAAGGTWAKGPIFVAMFLGLRRGEICGLKWNAIDRTNLRLSVDTQRDPNFGEMPTKGEARSIPIPNEILAYLDDLGDRDSIYVFTDGGKPLLPNELSKKVPRLCEAAGLEKRTLHDLRSFAASNLASMGVPPFDIMEILGHTKIDTTWLYIDGREKRQREGLRDYLKSVMNPVDICALKVSNRKV